MKRYTLRYVTAKGAEIVLTGLGEEACDQIEFAQSALGSREFDRFPDGERRRAPAALYEIQFPAAAAMVAAERAEKLPALIHYKGNTVAANVAFRIRRQEWLDAGGEDSVQLVAAMLSAIGNVPEYQRAVLRELTARVDKAVADGSGYRGRYHVNGLWRNGLFCLEPRKAWDPQRYVDLQLQRVDFGVMP